LESQQLFFLQSELVDFIKLPPRKMGFSKSFLHQKYVVEGLCSSEIAALTFSSRAAVTRWLNKYGIPLKTITRRETGGQVYGYRRYLGMSIPVKKEQKVIELIKKCRRKKMSYHKIAEHLNDKGIKIKHGQGKWYAKVVRQIFQREDGDIDCYSHI
jgi:transposase